MNLTEIKSAVDAGKKVFWMNQGYQVKKRDLGYFIECQFENKTVELHKKEGTLNGKEEEFFLGEEIPTPEVPSLTAPVLSAPTEIPKNNDEIKDIITKELDLKILVVEDDFAVLHLMLSLLKACNNRVSGASSAEEALNLIELAQQKNEPFQLIYLDINLPKLKGLDFCR